jgi:hypothetical protein
MDQSIGHGSWVDGAVHHGLMNTVGVVHSIDVLYAAPQAHRIVNVALHQKNCLGIVFIFSQGRKDLYYV